MLAIRFLLTKRSLPNSILKASLILGGIIFGPQAQLELETLQQQRQQQTKPAESFLLQTLNPAFATLLLVDKAEQLEFDEH